MLKHNVFIAGIHSSTANKNVSASLVAAVVSLFGSVHEVLLRCFTLTFVNYVLPSTSGDKKSAESRVKELEEALAAQRAESKKALDAAKDSAALRERGYAERLVGLARDVGG